MDTKEKKNRNLQISNIHSENESKMLISPPTSGYDHGFCERIVVCVCFACYLVKIVREENERKSTSLIFMFCLLAKFKNGTQRVHMEMVE